MINKVVCLSRIKDNQVKVLHISFETESEPRHFEIKEISNIYFDYPKICAIKGQREVLTYDILYKTLHLTLINCPLVLPTIESSENMALSRISGYIDVGEFFRYIQFSLSKFDRKVVPLNICVPKVKKANLPDSKLIKAFYSVQVKGVAKHDGQLFIFESYIYAGDGSNGSSYLQIPSSYKEDEIIRNEIDQLFYFWTHHGRSIVGLKEPLALENL